MNLDNLFSLAAFIFNVLTAVLLAIIGIRNWVRVARSLYGPGMRTLKTNVISAFGQALAETWRVDRGLIVVTLLSLLGLVISLLLLNAGQAALGAVSGALGLAIAAGKLLLGGAIAGAGDYGAHRLLKKFDKKVPTTAPDKDG
jgi:hypothetical protein